MRYVKTFETNSHFFGLNFQIVSWRASYNCQRSWESEGTQDLTKKKKIKPKDTSFWDVTPYSLVDI
jgi:hypothetical protein